MISSARKLLDFTVVVDDRGQRTASIHGEPSVLWESDGKLAAASELFPGAPRGRSLFDRITCGQGQRDNEPPWSGVAWDPERRRLHAIRDPLGQVPLSWFANEARAGVGTSEAMLSSLCGVTRLPNAGRLATFCLGGPDTSTQSFIDDVHRIRPGEALELGPASQNTRLWWDSADPRSTSRLRGEFIPGPSSEDDDPATILERHLLRAIDTIDGPITLALSGGVDSALLATFLSGRADVDAIHLTSDRHPSVDEREWARAVASATNLRLKVRIIDDEPIWHHSPSSHPQLFPVTALDRVLRQTATGTLMTGIGADQLFDGARASTLRGLANELSLGPWAREASFDRATLRATLLGLVERTQLGATALSIGSSIRSSGSPAALERREPWLKASAWVARAPLSEDGPLHRRWEWEHVMRNAWSVGPAAHPFLRPELWRFASNLGPHSRFANGHGKAIVRDLLARRNPELAASVARRPKSQTFNAWALDAMLRSHVPDTVENLSRLGVVRPVTFRNRWNALRRVAQRPDAEWGNFHVVAMWRTIAAEQWLSNLESN